jgi:hypothetical protein
MNFCSQTCRATYPVDFSSEHKVPVDLSLQTSDKTQRIFKQAELENITGHLKDLKVTPFCKPILSAAATETIAALGQPLVPSLDSHPTAPQTSCTISEGSLRERCALGMNLHHLERRESLIADVFKKSAVRFERLQQDINFVRPPFNLYNAELKKELLLVKNELVEAIEHIRENKFYQRDKREYAHEIECDDVAVPPNLQAANQCLHQIINLKNTICDYLEKFEKMPKL